MRQRQSSWWSISDVTRDGVELWWAPKTRRWVAMTDPLTSVEHVVESRRFKTATACWRAARGLDHAKCDSIVTHWVRRRGKRYAREFPTRGAIYKRGERYWSPPR